MNLNKQSFVLQIQQLKAKPLKHQRPKPSFRPKHPNSERPKPSFGLKDPKFQLPHRADATYLFLNQGLFTFETCEGITT